MYYGDDVSDTEFACKRDGAVVDSERVEGGVADVRGVESDDGDDAGSRPPNFGEKRSTIAGDCGVILLAVSGRWMMAPQPGEEFLRGEDFYAEWFLKVEQVLISCNDARSPGCKRTR